MTIFASRQGLAEDVTFNPNALEIDNPSVTSVDLTQFSSEGGQAQGMYHVDVFVNNEKKTTKDLNFVTDKDDTLVPQITIAQLDDWGVMVNLIPEFKGLPKETVISDLSHYIPQASINFDFSRQLVKFSIPQALMQQNAHGYVDPKYWDKGISAFLMDYNFTGSNNDYSGSSSTGKSYFLNLRSGANFGAWRLRNYSTWNYTQSSGTADDYSISHWDSINTYMQREIPKIKGQLTLGDNYTQSDIFDSVQFRGVQVVSDDNMLPDSLRGFAPTVSGIANSNAKVTIKQNGTIIYQTYVPPGAFSINDLFPTSSSGDLQVTITEADGSERTFIQPFSNVPVMQREGRLKYGFTIGEYRAFSDKSNEPILGQATLMYGLPRDVTLYGGFQTADKYNALALGVGFSLGEAGSVSMDATQAFTTLDKEMNGIDRSQEGQSYRFQYSKDILSTDSTVTLAGYRYSTKGFYTFQEAMDYNNDDDGNYSGSNNNRRSKLQLQFTQNLNKGDWGSLSFSGYQQDYWNEKGYERSLSTSYSNSVWNGISWSLMYTYTELARSYESTDQQLALSVSIPFSKWLPGAYISTNMVNDMHGKTHSQATLSGTALEGNNLSYSLAQGFSNKDEGYSGAVYGDYKGTYGELNAGYNYDKDSQQINYGVQGSVIVHQNGVTFGQPMSGDMTSVALVEAPGAAGAKLQNGTGMRTDWRGYAIVPYLSPYQRTRIGLEPGSLAEDVDMKENVTSVVPTAGAIVRATFKTNVGSRALITLSQGNHKVPFGALVSVNGIDSDNTGIVGEEGLVYLSGLPGSGDITAIWGAKGSQQCHAHFDIHTPVNNEKTANAGIQLLNVNCK